MEIGVSLSPRLLSMVMFARSITSDDHNLQTPSKYEQNRHDVLHLTRLSDIISQRHWFLWHRLWDGDSAVVWRAEAVVGQKIRAKCKCIMDGQVWRSISSCDGLNGRLCQTILCSQRGRKKRARPWWAQISCFGSPSCWRFEHPPQQRRLTTARLELDALAGNIVWLKTARHQRHAIVKHSKQRADCWIKHNTKTTAAAPQTVWVNK